MKLINTIWEKLGSIQLTFYLITLMVVDLTTGFFFLKAHPHLFQPLNDTGFIKWATTYAKSNPYESAWLFILIFLMTILSVNTFACTTQRMILLVRHHGFADQKIRFILKLSPHIMHYAMLIMLLGYLVSYLTSQAWESNVLLPGKTVRLPGSSCQVRLTDLAIDYYQGKRLVHMQDRGIDVRAALCIQCEKGKEPVTGILGYNRPIGFRGYSLHLKDFAPKSKSGMAIRKYIQFTIRKDPGTGFYFTGMILFTIGLLLYLTNWLTARN
ncbi:MAG: hypothetical protein KJ737_02990 [Proteobacteria bacterium]|nr:hypothetical protein [Pseudomonadota bacterium]